MATKKTSPKTKKVVSVQKVISPTREKVQTVRSNHVVRLLLILALILLASWMMYSIY